MFETARRLCLTLIVLVGFTATASAQVDPGQADFERGQTLLKEGKFKEALDLYQKAVKAAPANRGYAEKVAAVRQILMVEGIAANESDPRWPKAVHMLHQFYLSNGLAKRALPLDRKLHAREGTKETGLSLAMTLSEVKQIAEATEVLGEVLKKGEDTGVRVLRAIFQVRLGKADAARADLAKTPAALTDSGELYNRACAYALLGDKEKALSELTLSFQKTPAEQLAASKEWSKKDPDLASIHGTPGFAKALEIASGCADDEGGCEDDEESGCGTKPECGGCDKSK